MKIYVEYDDGTKHRIQDIETLGGDGELLFIKMQGILKADGLMMAQEAFEGAIKTKKVIVIDSRVADIICI